MSTSPRDSRPLGLFSGQPLWATVRRHPGVVLACLLLTPLAAGIQGKLTEPQFVSRASLIVKLGREFQAQGAGGGRGASMFRLNEALNSEIEILTSRQLAGEVVMELGLGTLYPELAEREESAEILHAVATELFLDDLAVSGIAESSVMEVAYAHPDPALARRALDLLLEHFQVRHVEVFGEKLLPHTERQVGAIVKSLDEAEARRTAYRWENSIFDEGEQRTLLLRRRDALTTTSTLLEGQLRLAAGDETVAGGAAGSETAQAAAAELLRLRAEERRLLELYFEDSRTVKAVRDQIRAQEELLDALRTSTAGALTDQLEAARVELAQVEDELRELASHERRLREFDRDVLRLEALYSAAIESAGAARLSAELDEAQVSSVRLIDPPTLPVSPTGLGLLPRVVLAAIAGAILAASAILLLHLVESQDPHENSVAI